MNKEISLKQLDPKRFKEEKRFAQQERRLRSLGATDATIKPITGVLSYLDTQEFSRTIPARDTLYQRLIDLTEGKTLPLVVFNCLDFTWEEDPGRYPKATILDDTSTSIANYFENILEDTSKVLGSLSPQGEDAIDL